MAKTYSLPLLLSQLIRASNPIQNTLEFFVHFQMNLQIVRLRRWIITLVAFVWLFSTVRFQMGPQITCPKGCIVTLVAFVWLFSVVHFKMTSQSAFHRGCILTFVAVVWFFSFFICVSQGNIFIDPTEVITCKILIHHHQLWIVVSCVLSVSNWENEDCGREESESHCWRQYHNLQQDVCMMIMIFGGFSYGGLTWS